MIEHKYFLSLMDYAEAYFESAHDDGFFTRNDIINMAVTDISEYVNDNPSLKDKGKKDIRHLNAQKVTGSEADLQKLNSLFMQIMKDVKKEYGEESSDISRQEMQKQIQAIHDEALAASKQGNLDIHRMADITAKMVEPLGFDEEQMQERGISRADVKRTIATGEIIEDYLDDFPNPSCLIFGYTVNNRVLHVIAGCDNVSIYIVTAYYPDTKKFENDLKTRRRV